MNRTSAARLTLATALLGLAGCGGDEPASADDGATAAAETRDLDRDAVEDYLAAMNELRSRGQGPETEPGDSASSMQQFASGFAVKEEWEDVLEDHDLDARSFVEIHLGLVKAFGRLMVDEQRAEIEAQQQAAYEKMKESMGEEAAKQMLEAQKSAMGAATGMFGDVPPEHVELAKEMRDEIEAAWRGE